MAIAYQIHGSMEAAKTPSDLAKVLDLHASDILAIDDRGFSSDLHYIREAALKHAERVSGLTFTRLLSDALKGTPL